MVKKYVMGCDGGTGGMRVGIYALDGTEIAFASTEYPTYYPQPGWAEQAPMDWWNAMGKSVRKAMEKAGICKEEVAALSYDGTCGSILLAMNDGTPIGNSAIWMDIRAEEEAKIVSATNHEALKFNDYDKVPADWMPCKVLWIKKHRQEDYARAEKVCDYADWISFKLTGNWTSNLSSVASRWYYDSLNGGYPKDFYAQLGIEDVLDKLPGELHSVGDRIGTLTPEAAAFLGLPEDTVVGQGGVDASIGLFGLGVVKPGRAALITGSSHLILGLTDNYSYSKSGVFGPYPDAILKGYGLVEGGQNSTGSIMNWFKKYFCKDLDALSEGAYAVLNEAAAKIPIGSDGLLLVDWFQGNRTPYADTELRGMLYGLSLGHTQAHIFRAIMEGVAYGTENAIQGFKKAGFPIREVYISGGTVNSPLWMQIHADVSNVTIHVPKNPQAPTLGAAILAAVAAGIYTVDEAVARMVHYSHVIHPNPENHEKYQKIFARYQAVYDTLGDWMRETTATFIRLS